MRSVHMTPPSQVFMFDRLYSPADFHVSTFVIRTRLVALLLWITTSRNVSDSLEFKTPHMVGLTFRPDPDTP